MILAPSKPLGYVFRGLPSTLVCLGSRQSRGHRNFTFPNRGQRGDMGGRLFATKQPSASFSNALWRLFTARMSRRHFPTGRIARTTANRTLAAFRHIQKPSARTPVKCDPFAFCLSPRASSRFQDKNRRPQTASFELVYPVGFMAPCVICSAAMGIEALARIKGPTNITNLPTGRVKQGVDAPFSHPKKVARRSI
jgi:hypothetical protein